MSISLFCDHLSVLDIAYLDKALGLVGASYYVNVEFVGNTDQDGILIDFSLAKKQVKQVIDETCDHRFVLPKGMAQITDQRFQLEYNFSSNNKNIFYTGPTQAICEIKQSHVSTKAIESFLEEQLNTYFRGRFDQIKIQLEEQNLKSEKAILHYTHGLKTHYGNCQRLFHGHHNSVDIWVNGQERPDLENWLVRDVLKSNVHFCFWENVVNKKDFPLEEAKLSSNYFPNMPFVEISYSSSQGDFRAMLPGDMVFIVEDESTIENLSIFFAKLVQTKCLANDHIKVKAYEGIAKGAISYLS